jgi:hypothetical protein
MVVQGVGAVSYERGTPVATLPHVSLCQPPLTRSVGVAQTVSEAAGERGN